MHKHKQRIEHTIQILILSIVPFFFYFLHACMQVLWNDSDLLLNANDRCCSFTTYTTQNIQNTVAKNYFWHVVKQYKRWWNVYPTINNKRTVKRTPTHNSNDNELPNINNKHIHMQKWLILQDLLGKQFFSNDIWLSSRILNNIRME